MVELISHVLRSFSLFDKGKLVIGIDAFQKKTNKIIREFKNLC